MKYTFLDKYNPLEMHSNNSSYEKRSFIKYDLMPYNVNFFFNSPEYLSRRRVGDIFLTVTIFLYYSWENTCARYKSKIIGHRKTPPFALPPI